MKFTDEINAFMDEMKEDSYCPVFLTGEAGTGKSTLLRHFIDSTKSKHVCLAPTGVAALNIQGQTIHSFFQLPIHTLCLTWKPEVEYKWEKTELIKKLSVILIDEISMVRADTIDAIDKVLRFIKRRPNTPFGGIRLVFIGDLYQLPTIVRSQKEKEYFKDTYGTSHFFNAKVFEEIPIRKFKLTKIFRQNDNKFISILNKIRMGNVDKKCLDDINSRVGSNTDNLILCCSNAEVNNINNLKLNSLWTEEKIFTAELEGRISEKDVTVPERLILKEGARVMITRNDPQGEYVNGSQGTIRFMNDLHITVKLDNGNLVTVYQTSWEKYSYTYSDGKICKNISGRFTQFPLKVCYALSIHKSQGLTFNACTIDLGRGAFAPGQVYVALSRLTDISGLSLKREIKFKDIIVDRDIEHFMDF